MVDIEALCIAKGLRMTGQRRTITRILSQSKSHPDAEAVHRRAVQENPHISIATVYRTIRLLEENDIITKHTFLDGRAARYEPADVEHHDHLIDIQSGKVVEFQNDKIEKLQKLVARELGYKLVDHRLELYGVPIKSKE